MLFSKCIYSGRHWANTDEALRNHSLQWLWATGRLPTSASPSWQFSIDVSCLVLMWMGLNHMVSLSLSLTVLKNVVLSALAANWSEPIVDSHHHQQVIFPLRVWLLIMYRKSKWKCGYNLTVLGHGEFTLREQTFLLASELLYVENLKRKFCNYSQNSLKIDL